MTEIETKLKKDPKNGIQDVALREALETRYLSYALSTILHRALPDVRDGMKPVHRRLLYAMRQLKLDPSMAFKKCARVVGDVIGKYHPHGDQAVYEALVRLAQDFSQRYPLIEGQGNFGNVDGDRAAAMRYTESRLTDLAMRLLEGLDENAVEFQKTYDGAEEEPLVLPGGVPNLLANGSSGIAVGMATSIPPHNLAELCAGALYLIAHPTAEIDDLLQHIPGPDFPTGGLIVETPAEIRKAYATGRGGFRLRARWHKEERERGGWVVVITEIPYQVQKARLIEKIAERAQERKLPLLADLRDESTEEVRIVLEPKSRQTDPSLLMELLFKLTELEVRFPLNMNVLTPGHIPRVLNLRQMLQAWLDHRREVLQRRMQHRLQQMTQRLEVLEGLLIAYLNLDAVIRIIREEEDPKTELQARFALTLPQVNAILDMRLRALHKLEEMTLRKEHATLLKEQEKLRKLLEKPALQWAAVAHEIETVRKIYGPNTELGRRRTEFGAPVHHETEDLQQAMTVQEPITVVLSEKGWIRSFKGHLTETAELSFKVGDHLKLMVHAQTTDTLLIAADTGRFFTLSANKLPSARSHGEPIRLLIDLAPEQDIIQIFAYQGMRHFLLASSAGHGFVVPESELLCTTRKGKQIMTLPSKPEGVRAAFCCPAEGEYVAVIGTHRKLLVFPLAQIPIMNKGRGVRLQRLRTGQMTDVRIFKATEGLCWNDSSGRRFVRSIEELLEWRGDRAQVGRLPPPGFPRSNRFAP